MPEEIETPGDGQIRAVITIAGNPVLSAPDGPRLSEALETVDFMLSVDPYLNETTRHADVILPPPPPSRAAHLDIALSGAVVRNNARYSPPALPLADGRPDECEILARVALIALGLGTDADPALVDDQVITATLAREVADPHSPVADRSAEELTAMLPDGSGYERRLDMMLRLGPFGDAFGTKPEGLNLARLKDNPHGIDLGALTSSWRRRRFSPTYLACLPRWIPRTVSCLSGVGTCAPTTVGCTTCPRCPAVPTVAPCRSTPTTPPDWV